ncbi:tetratricopeptide repeat protein [Amycolatopsis nalaikhensis]|uniref:Tetratricopeptide repeat protein n=1 Tax=Amycolatopsis nalaikhensis TaxID=715472 RepID=A0ABY8XR41_9PSEU|nr:hypothetical protein [Amycolatopsis sp. 2-2]WIV57987.1 hypothetical protein QP939_04740 [Amycolatopsis sp. 2-2]
MDEELAADGARYFADACSASGHTLSPPNGSPCRCEVVAARFEADRKARFEAQIYDVSKTLLKVDGSDTFPSAEWPMAALMRTVVDEITEPPWTFKSPPRRMVRITKALAHIGELGLPPDALVRVGLARKLRLMITSFVIAHFRFNESALPSSPVPAVQDWLDLAVSCIDSPTSEHISPNDELLSVIPSLWRGQFSAKIDEWLQTACIRDIVAWQLHADPHDPLTEEDLNIRGGHEAILWTVDRFSQTHYSTWHRTSLYWELRFSSNPEATAAEAGLTASTLLQRPSHTGLVVEAIVSRASFALDHETSVRDITHDQLEHQVIFLLQRGFAAEAVATLRAVLRLYPGLNNVRSMLGFCLITTDPTEALSVIDRVHPEENLPAELILINRISALLRIRDFDSARQQLEGAISTFTDEVEYLLWQPADLAAKSTNPSNLAALTAKSWGLQARAVLNEARPT